MEATMIKVEHVSKAYHLNAVARAAMQNDWEQKNPAKKTQSERINQDGMFMALSDVSFEVNTGEALGIIGRNGAGKSTLLKLITKITHPTSGKIYLNGRVASLLEVGTGFHRDLTGRENIYINGAVLGMSRKEIDKKLDEIIDFSECSQFIDIPVKHYSSGMYMKLGFSVASHLDAEIMIIDEILAVGDFAFRNKCIKKMREVSAAGRTILYVGHSMNTVRNICSRCIVLDQGKLEYDGDTEPAIANYVAKNSTSIPAVSGSYTEPSRELAQLERPYRTHQMARMEYIELDGDNSFLMGNMLRFLLRWNAQKGFECLCLRVGVWSVNGDAATVSFVDLSPALSGEGEHEASFCLDTSRLLPGKYSLELLMIEKDLLGEMKKQDALRDTLGFEILALAEHPVYQAYNRDWGYIELPITVNGK